MNLVDIREEILYPKIQGVTPSSWVLHFFKVLTKDKDLQTGMLIEMTCNGIR
jgi:hypothetical protein